jgi:hypothetical protein
LSQENYNRDYAYDPYKFETNAMVENIQDGNVEINSYGCRNHVTPPDITEALRSLRVELQSYRVDNKRLIEA